MRRLLSVIAVVALAMAIGSLYAAETKENTWHGIITDDMCGKKHLEMTPEKARECALSCVKKGSHLVLYNKKDDKTFMLSDQAKATEFAGEHVVVNGTIDAAGKEITVTSIQKGEKKQEAEKKKEGK